MRELSFMATHYENKVKMFQALEHASYDVQYSQMSGKKIFKDSFLRKRFPLLYNENKVIGADEANKMLKKIGLVEDN